MPYLRYLCLSPHSGVQHILCSVLCFVCLCLVSNLCNVASFSGLYILYCSFAFLCLLFSNSLLHYFKRSTLPFTLYGKRSGHHNTELIT
jgi:hypothetical protein